MSHDASVESLDQNPLPFQGWNTSLESVFVDEYISTLKEVVWGYSTA